MTGPLSADPTSTWVAAEQLTRVDAGPARYALLVAPSSNRVYAGESIRLTGAELAVFGDAVLDGRLRTPAPVTLGGVPYLEFAVDPPLDGRDLDYLSRLSAGYALFEALPEGRLLPVALTPHYRYDDDLVTIPKYTGKTNEQFTQLLLNVTVLASAWADQMLERQMVVLDPLCGRGTTLHQALRYGYDAIGIEADGGHVDAYGAFLRSWLRRKRLKHNLAVNPVRHDGRRVARRLNATVSPSKEAHRGGDIQQVSLYHADTLDVSELLRPGCCDVIVTDAPYGIAHRSRASDNRSRAPGALLAQAVPRWAGLLRRGGALGISFNLHTLPRDELAGMLTDAGLTVAAYPDFAHWVDQGITRDLLVARKPAGSVPASRTTGPAG